MANKQPFYHSVSVLFTTAGGPLTEAEFRERLIAVLAKHKNVIHDSVIVEAFEAEPGDPADLL